MIFIDIETHAIPADDPAWLAYLTARPDADRMATALDPMMGRLSCMCWAVDDGPVDCAVEQDAIMEALADIGRTHKAPRFCGHNIDGFDGPFLQIKAYSVNRPRIAELFGAPGQKPWERPTVDTKQLWPHFRTEDPVRGINGASLPSVARVLGLAPPTTAPGSEAPRLWEEGRRDEVIAHCREDVDLLRKVYRRLVWR